MRIAFVFRPEIGVGVKVQNGDVAVFLLKRQDWGDAQRMFSAQDNRCFAIFHDFRCDFLKLGKRFFLVFGDGEWLERGYAEFRVRLAP